jgi:hypothetical protein
MRFGDPPGPISYTFEGVNAIEGAIHLAVIVPAIGDHVVSLDRLARINHAAHEKGAGRMLVVEFQWRRTHQIADKSGNCGRAQAKASQPQVSVRANSPPQFRRKIEIDARIESNLLGQLAGVLGEIALPSVDPMNAANSDSVASAKKMPAMATSQSFGQIGPTAREGKRDRKS